MGKAIKAHHDAADAHNKFDGEQHLRASQAHTHEAKRIYAMAKKHHEKWHKQRNFGNIGSFNVFNANQPCITEYRSSARQAKDMVTHLKEGRHQEACDGAPHKLPKCSKEPFPFCTSDDTT
jgi:hypothetical protein